MAESMMGLKRTHRCAELSQANIGEKVTIMGWVQKNRNKGGLVFVDVRDRSGLIQVVFEEGSTAKELLDKAAKLRSEFVVAVVGTVEARSGAVNENLATGAIEIKPEELRILSEAETPPFPIEENSKTKEELRLKYRYLDLRRPDLQRNLMMRSKDPDTVCGTVSNIGREGEMFRVMTLKELRDTRVDMFTTVYIGNSQTKMLNGKMVTPRGYIHG